MESALRVDIVPRTPETPTRVRIAGVEFPVVGYAIEADPDSGGPLLSLALAPDMLSIGDPVTATPAPAAVTAPAISSWGGGSQPDPRESIPGWPPTTLSGQVAGHAEQRVSITWQPNAGHVDSGALVRIVRRAFGGEGGSVAVPA